MSSKNKLAKIDKRNHGPRGKHFMKGFIKLRRASFYTSCQRRMLDKITKENDND